MIFLVINYNFSVGVMDKGKQYEKLNELSRKMLEILFEYYFEEYKFGIEDLPNNLINTKYKKQFEKLIKQAKMQEKLTYDEYKKELFFHSYDGKLKIYQSLFNDFFNQKTSECDIYSNVKPEKEYIKNFSWFYDMSANYVSEFLASNQDITEDSLFEVIDAIDFELDINSPDQIPLTEKEKEFDKEMTKFILSYIHFDTRNTNSKNSFNDYYEKYCLANNILKISTKNNIFYDFNSKDKYRNYGDKISNFYNVNKDKITKFFTFFDIEKTLFSFEKLCKEDFYLSFDIYNEKTKRTNLFLLHHFSKYTKNYNQKTIDVVIFDNNKKSISIYPIDANDFTKKFRKIKSKYNSPK